MHSIIDFLLDQVRRHMPPGNEQAVIDADTPLKSIGFSSLDLVALIVDLERELQINFPATALNSANFQSVTAISRLVIPMIGPLDSQETSVKGAE